MEDTNDFGDALMIGRSIPLTIQGMVGYVDQARSVGGITVGDVRYSIQTRGYKYGAAAVIQHIELCRDAEVLASEPNTEEGRERLSFKISDLYCEDELQLASDAEFLINQVNSINEVR